MGNTAPKHYLACDGSVVNILDYPELANYFNIQFGSKNYFGGNGTTTFAVPDLRGEFLRGTGTNSHSGQGNGGEVGEHQDGTAYSPQLVANNKIYTRLVGGTNYGPTTKNEDATEPVSLVHTGYTSYSNDDLDTYPWITSRPTNTSVLYCIATKNIYIDPKNNYSTEEQVVGTWIDGKPLYQKTFEIPPFTHPNYGDTGSQFCLMSADGIELVDAYGVLRKTTGTQRIYVPGTDIKYYSTLFCVDHIAGDTDMFVTLFYNRLDTQTINFDLTSYATLKYTKNTD
jgi:microcystin-dependent protein